MTDYHGLLNQKMPFQDVIIISSIELRLKIWFHESVGVTDYFYSRIYKWLESKLEPFGCPLNLVGKFVVAPIESLVNRLYLYSVYITHIHIIDLASYHMNE